MDAVVPLISAAIAGLVAWIVARRTARTARENWVLDKRFVIYERVLAAALAVTGNTWEQARDKLHDDAIVRALKDQVLALNLLAPVGIQRQGLAVAHLVDQASTDDDVVAQVGEAIGSLLLLLREDLVPKHMR